MSKKIYTKRVSQNVSDDSNMYLWSGNTLIVADYVDGYEVENINRTTGESEYEYVEPAYVLKFHNGFMPAFDTNRYESVEALAAAMKGYSDLRSWRVGSENA